MTTSTTSKTAFGRALDKLQREDAKANAEAEKLAAEERAKADAHQRQADDHSARVAEIDAKWQAGDETASASDRASAVAERDRSKALAAGRLAAATAARQQMVNKDASVAENVAQAIRASVQNAYPVHAIASHRGRELPKVTTDDVPVIVVSQVEPAKRQQDGSLQGLAHVNAYLPSWAAPVQWDIVERAAEDAGIKLRVPDGSGLVPEPDADGITRRSERVTVLRGAESLPLIEEIDHGDNEMLLDAIQPLLAALEPRIGDDQFSDVRVRVDGSKRLPIGKRSGIQTDLAVSWRQLLTPTSELRHPNPSAAMKLRMREEAEDRAAQMHLRGLTPAGRQYRHSGPEATAGLQQAVRSTVGMFLPGVGSISSITAKVVDVQQEKGRSHSRYELKVSAVSRDS